MTLEEAYSGLKIAQKTYDFLKQHSDNKYTANEIANWIFNNYPIECKKKQKRSTAQAIPLNDDKDLINQIAAEIAAKRPRLQNQHPQIKTTEGRPKKYYYTEQSDAVEIIKAEENSFKSEETQNENQLSEKDLYPILSEYLWSELEIYSKRINEKCSKNSRGPNGNKWLYPDVVGMQDLTQGWLREVKDCVKVYSDKETKLWSFEVKILLNRSNVRESFFQTVSNSGWANFSYLVASEIEEKTLLELRMLSSLHGIGVIKLDTEMPSESQILIPAKERPDVDWSSANRIADENSDFLEYIKLIKQAYQTGEVRRKDWDH
ncbi:HrgA protein [Silvanigrella paludirubra]|uniref:HrgA protein n=1 Tax=Silvanigrella paludirubra TaxID=2499159 RepID=A0A6N6VUW3_9BACT|nr:HrgA protein [Silvanigrella paludirubra]KAB8036881.1 HrgA protein [Silvanigrella paludirubra]